MSFTVLIADDEELERRALRRILGTMEEPIDIVEAANGRQAIETARDAQPDLALLDIRMPGVDGIAAARELKSVSPRTRCVFVTAFESFDYAREAMRLGADEYLLKPAEPDAVKATVLRAIARQRQERNEIELKRRADEDGERARDLLERELRDALNRGGLEGSRLFSYLSLRGLHEGERFALVLRPAAPEGAGKADIRRSAIGKLQAVAERVLRDAGWFVISGADDAEVRLAAACVVAKAPEGPLPRSVKDLLERIAERCRVDGGIPALIGAAPAFPADGPELFSAAQDALALATPDRPIIVLEPAVPETPAERTQRLSRGGPVVDKAMEYLKARLAEDLSLSDVAAYVNCSPFHLSRLFRLQAGDTFVRCFARLRIDAAKALLRSGNYSVKEAGTMVGFADQTYFARVFKRLEGVSPAEYKAARHG